MTEMIKRDTLEKTEKLRSRIVAFIKKNPKKSAYDMLKPIFGDAVTKPKKAALYRKMLYNLRKLETEGKLRSEVINSTAPLPKRVYYAK
jgi:hypothetical protein